VGASAKQNTLPAHPVPSFGSRLGHPFFECGQIGFYTVLRLSGSLLAQFLLLGAAIFALYTMAGRPETGPTQIRVGSTSTLVRTIGGRFMI
jgi:hypothetical protein